VVRIRMAGAKGREGKRKPPRVLCRCRRDCRRGLSPTRVSEDSSRRLPNILFLSLLHYYFITTDDKTMT
jgi:hypothetical protein